MEKENKVLKEEIKKLEEQIELIKTINRLQRDLLSLKGIDYRYGQPVIYNPVIIPQYIPYVQYVSRIEPSFRIYPFPIYA